MLEHTLHQLTRGVWIIECYVVCDGIEITKQDGSTEKWMDEIEPSLVKIHAYWGEMRGS